MLALVLVACAASFAGASATAQSESAAQRCVDRWNWTREFEPSGGPSVWVLTRPCTIYVQYRYAARNVYFACDVDPFGVFACAEHGGTPVPKLLAKVHRAPTGTINRYTGVITLKGAAVPTVQPRPGWVKRWRWVEGFIFPFDNKGGLLPGIVERHAAWTGQFKQACGLPYPRRLFSTCANGLYVLYPRWPLHKGDVLAFSFSRYRGSRTYVTQRYAP